ncbi:MAG: efflux RND transporter periplasmic adaptor subunit [Myxococcales bacterium]
MFNGLHSTAGAVALCCSLIGCSTQEPAREAPEAQAASSVARFQSVEAARESSWLDAPARVVSSPNDTALISVPLSARVRRVRVRAGQTVNEGDALVDVVMPELIRAAGALRSAELRLQSWQERRAVVAPLLEKGLARAAELSDIDANIASVRGDRESARATLRAAGELDTRAAGLLDGDGAVALRAPLTGVVVSVNAKLGEMREPNAGPLLELVSADADPRVEARFATPPPVGVTFEWVDVNRSVPLVLDALSPHADERDGLRVAWLHAREPEPGLVAGTLGRVRMKLREDWVVIPSGALSEERGQTYVEVRDPVGTHKLPVKVIRQSGTEALVEGVPLQAQVAVDVRGGSAVL